MGRVVHNGSNYGNGLTIEEAIVHNSDENCPELELSPDKFAIELDVDSYIEEDVQSSNYVEIFSLA